MQILYFIIVTFTAAYGRPARAAAGLKNDSDCTKRREQRREEDKLLTDCAHFGTEGGKDDKRQGITDACHNFYHHICEKEKRRRAITQKLLKERLHKKLKDILTQPDIECSIEENSQVGNNEEMRLWTLAKRVYDVCVEDADKEDSMKMRRAVSSMLRSVGITKWPLRGKHQHAAPDVLTRAGLRPVASVKAVPKSEGPMYLLTANILLPRFAPHPNIMKEPQKRKNQNKFKSYLAFMHSVIKLAIRPRSSGGRPDHISTLQNTKEEEAIAQVMDDILEVETELVKMSHDPTPRNDYDERSVNDWQNLFGPGLPFISALESDFRKANLSLSEETVVGIHNIDYFKTLAEYLRNLEVSKLANYIGWFYTRDMADVLTETIRRKLNDFLLTNLKPGIPILLDAEKCLEKLIGYDGVMETAMVHLYLKAYFGAASIKKAVSVAPYLNASLFYLIERNNWMDSHTRNTMNLWIANLQYQMGASPNLLNAKWVVQQYQFVELPEKKSLPLFFFLVKENNFWQNLRLNGQPYTRKDIWPASPLTTAGRYSQLYTLVEMPAGALQAPLYKYHEMNAAIFGSMGTLTTETMTNGFLDEGQETFQLNRNYAWTENARKKFERTIGCLKKNPKAVHSSKERITSQELFDKNQDESVLTMKATDHISLRTAYNAFAALAGEAAEKCQSFGKNAQLRAFFASYAKRYCGEDAMKEDEHRVNYVLKTFKKFWSAFGCKENDKMKSRDICKIIPESEAIAEPSA